MYGIISHSCIDVIGHSLFQNFRQALSSYLNCEFIDVNNINNLDTIKYLFIIDEHYDAHRGIWSTNSFIDACNARNISVIVFNFEKIFNSQFYWNIDHQNQLQRFNKLLQFNSDAQDLALLKNPVIKQLLSRETELVPIPDKEDKILFIGQLVPEYYPGRCSFIEEIKGKINIEINNTDRKLSYTEFLDEVAKTKYLLNPLGTGNFINLRFYEALKLGCIVLQQYIEEMEEFYSEELNHPSVVKFKTIDELIEKLKTPITFTPFEKTLEDYFEDIDLKNMINNIL